MLARLLPAHLLQRSPRPQPPSEAKAVAAATRGPGHAPARPDATIIEVNADNIGVNGMNIIRLYSYLIRQKDLRSDSYSSPGARYVIYI